MFEGTSYNIGLYNVVSHAEMRPRMLASEGTLQHSFILLLFFPQTTKTQEEEEEKR